MSKVIEKNVPIPERYEHPKDGLVKAMRQMKVGNSFECTEHERASAFSVAKYVGIKILTRRQPDGKFRLWRTA